MPANGPVAREAGERLRLVPAQAAAEDAAAAAQLAPARDRRRRPRGAGRRSAPARRRPRSIWSSRSRASPATLPTSARIIIGTCWSRKRLTASAGAPRFGEPHVGERIERARQIIGRARAAAARVSAVDAGDDADGAAAPALVEQLHRAGRALAGDLEPRDVVADLDRQVDRRLRSRVSPALKANGASPSGRPLRSSARTTPFSAPPASARSTFTVSAPAALSAAASACAGGRPPVTTVSGRSPVTRCEAGDEFRAAAEIDAVGEPDQLDMSGVRGKKRAISRQRVGALDGMRLRLELLAAATRAAPAICSEISRVGLRQRHERDAAVVGLGARDDVVGGAQARVPGRGGGPAVVDQQQRAAPTPVVVGERRIPQRAGGGEDDQRREQQPQQRQPPRRARRRLFLRRDVEQQPRRREMRCGAAAAA